MSTFDPSSFLNLLQATQGNSQGLAPTPQGGGTAPANLSGTNPQATFQSSNNSTPDAAPTPQTPPPPTPQAPPAGAQPQDQRLQGVKGYLANILHGVGEGMKAHLGMETDAQQQQRMYTQGLQTQKFNLDQQNIQSEIMQRAAVVKQMQSAVTLPNGMQVPFALAKPYIDAWGKSQAAATGKRFMIVPNVGMLDTQPEGGGNPKLVPGSSPQGVQVTPGIAQQYNIPLQLIGSSMPLGQFAQLERGGAAWAGNVSTSQQIIDTGNGLVPVTKTATSQKVAPNASSVMPTGTPQAPGQQPISTKPVSMGTSNGTHYLKGPDGKPLMGKSGTDVGDAYDPQTNQYFITNRAEALQNGYQNFQKSSPAQIENDRQLNNRVADVQQKMGRYQSTFSQDLSDRDKLDLTALMGDNTFKLGAFGTELPTGWLNKVISTNAFQNMSTQGQQRFIAWANARESLSGYQRVLTGSSRGNEKTLQLQLDTLASPLWQPAAAQEAFSQFGENLKIAGQGLPRMKGVQTGGDIEQKFYPGNQSGPPQGAKIRDYTQLK